jgi:hypothetical protein
MFSSLNEAVNKLMDGFFQQQEENQRLNKRCDQLQTELRDMQSRLLIEHEEFDLRIDSASKSFENLTLDHVLVGYHWGNKGNVIFVHKDADLSTLCERFGGSGRMQSYVMVIDGFQYLKNFAFEFNFWGSQLAIADKRGNIIFSPNPPGNIQTLEQMLQNPDTKNLYKVCKELGIKFVVNGSDSVNGVPIDKILS